MVKVTVEAPDLSRVIGNALAFLPAASKVRYILLDFGQGELIVSGTDTYTAGRDVCPLTQAEGIPPEGLPILLGVAEAKQLDSFSRAAKKGVVAVHVDPGGTLTAYPGEDADALTVPWEAAEEVLGLYERIEEVLQTVEGRAESWPGTLMVDPGLFTRFAKVKADATARMADLRAANDREPILIKIGPTFRGMLMPIRREAQAREFGSDGHW